MTKLTNVYRAAVGAKLAGLASIDADVWGGMPLWARLTMRLDFAETVGVEPSLVHWMRDGEKMVLRTRGA